jgi:hypothetical protein
MKTYAMPQNDSLIPADLWATIRGSVPILCVDLYPVRRAPSGTIDGIGLIERAAPFTGGKVWCHVGGRVNLDDSVADAMNRHSV